jgi:outer membrane protein OmpA-like peptidoglycan-associated protein
VNGRPVDWFNLSASYSVFNGKMSSVGAGLGLRTGFVSWVLAADYIPFYRSDLPISGSSFKVPLPYSTQGFNFSFGINLVLGNKKDTDKDGVVDKKDQCPETPFSVIVDKKGCPIDADGDGVPDYLDKCPRTPKEAYNKIDQNGCPVDNDSDGVADYRDKCPDTPIGVKVDSVGCPIDSDHDGVFDSLDKCPNTPLGVKVDSVGCPIDSDHDGVPDNIDKCPKTPLGVPVDSVGCPIDSDLDGVPDYIDKCPDTPIEERAMVDANGCTKKVTKSLVIEKTLINIDKSKNSQAVKKELQNLFKKALQGIQFESGKYLIRPISYKILNQIAGVLIANPTYLVEIRGHTDNAGKSAANMVLSTNRAKAVMKYLTGKKVPAERMTSNGYGDTLPVATNKTPTGRAINRRVEFIVSFEEITFQ